MAACLFCTSASAQIFEINDNLPQDGGDSRSANWVDLNMDGILDIYFTNGPSSGANNFAYLGFGNGFFTPYDEFSPLVLDQSRSVGATFAQANIFEGLDAFITTWYGDVNRFYTWTGTDYEEVEVAPPSGQNTYSETAAFADANGNGLCDLYVTNSAGADESNSFFAASQIGTYIEITEGAFVEDQGASRGVTWIDYDNDGDADIFVTNEDNTPNRLYQNQGDGSFVSIQDGVIATNAGATMSGTWGDYNNDGYMDLFICNAGSNNMLYKNGPDGFEAMTDLIVSNDGGFSFSANWGDIDNDGDLDLFVSNAFAPNDQALNNFLYINNGDGTFTKNETDIVTQNNGWTYGNAFGDYDGEGDLDLIAANCYNGNENNVLYQNMTSDGEDTPGFSEIFCIGTVSNPSAIGTRITLTATINGQSVTQIREITSQSSYCGQNMYPVHFGLGDATVVDELIIDYPNTPPEVFNNLIVPNLFLSIEGDPLTTFDKHEEIKVVVYPNPATDYVTIELEKAPGSRMVLELFDLSGKRVDSFGVQRMNEKKMRIELPELTVGTYILRGFGAEGGFSRKIQILQK